MAPIASTEAPAQYKQTSRKGKRAWRKNVDVSEIQIGLDEARDELARGGLLVDKPSEDLFALDSTGSTTIQAAVRQTYKPLRSDEILAQRSAVPAVATHKRADGITDGIIERNSKRRKTSGVNPREYERLRQVAYGTQTLDAVVQKDTTTPDHDPWANVEGQETTDARFTFLAKQKPTKAPITLKEAPKPLFANARSVPAVTEPNAGTSYNPAFQDWDALVTKEGLKEVEAEKKRLHKAKSEQELMERLAIAEKEAEQESAWQTEDESAWEGFESDFDKPEWLAKKQTERKTPQERKKAERKKERDRQEKIERKAREKDKQEKRILELRAELNKKTRRRGPSIHPEKVQDVDEHVLSRRGLRKDKVPAKGLEVVLPEELQDSLRRLKPEGNLLKDRYRNVLLSGKMEARGPISQSKKKRIKSTEKWSHKDFSIPIST